MEFILLVVALVLLTWMELRGINIIIGAIAAIFKSNYNLSRNRFTS